MLCYGLSRIIRATCTQTQTGQNRLMRKTISTPEPDPSRKAQEKWLDLENSATVEVTSEDSRFPIESALVGHNGLGWRAAERGKQTIRLALDKPTTLRRIRLEFSETENSRTQEFTLQWSRAGGPMTEIVRQQWTFSPQGATSEIEDYQVSLEDVSILELTLKPDLTPETAFSTLVSWRIA
jgi:hypothetical protein